MASGAAIFSSDSRRNILYCWLKSTLTRHEVLAALARPQEFRASITDAIGFFRARAIGLKWGHVWLNGHNLGECPQTVLMYMPECWFTEGANDLVVFDIAGAKPDQVKLASYETFSVAKAK